jgi:hypothetical protein
MSVGDITSEAKGSGARFNSGKPDVSLIPLRIIVESMAANHDRWNDDQRQAHLVLRYLSNWQERKTGNWLMAAWQALGPDAIAECAQVFDYGRRKYAAWNWSKGMAWSIPLACAARHIIYGILAGEPNDVESTHPHRGHVACNLAMLMTYERTFQEGDDRAPTGRLA